MSRSRMSPAKALLLAALFALVGAPATHAQQEAPPSPLTVSYQNVSLANDSVRAQTQSPTSALLGDTLRYQLVFTNVEDRTLRDVVFDNPLPNGLVFIPGSVNSSSEARVEYSVDGGVSFSERPTVIVLEDGRRIERIANPESYNALRWTVTSDLLPGAKVTVRFDARVGTRPPPVDR